MGSPRLTLWLRWVLANAVGELFGLGAASAGVVLLVSSGAPTQLLPWAVVLLGAVEGLAVGWAQWLVLKRALPALHPASWILATVGGAVTAWSIGFVPSLVADALSSSAGASAAHFAPGPLLTIVMAAVLGAVAGPVLAIFQWRSLRNHVRHAWRWIPANAVAWAVAMPLVFGIADQAPPVAPSAGLALLAAATLLTAGAVVGAIHGAVLVRLIVREPAPAAKEGRMRVLVTWGSKMGGTEGLARMIGAELEPIAEVVLHPAASVERLEGYDAVIVGGALYANRWHRDARRFVTSHLAELRRLPVWFFSSGPLDDSADRGTLTPTREVSVLMERVGALGHATFGGRLAPDAKGFPARSMARKMSGDFRRPEIVAAWARGIARVLPEAAPGVPEEPPARSWARYAQHAAAGAFAFVLVTELASRVPWGASVVQVLAAVLVALFLARSYFGERGAREPLPVALGFTATFAVLAVFAWGLTGRGLGSLGSPAGWVALGLVLLVTWGTGALMATMPWPKLPPTPTHAESHV